MLTAAQLQVLDQDLERLHALTDTELDAAIVQMGWPDEIAPADQRGSLAATLFGIEQACKLLRGRLNVELTIAVQTRITATLTDMAGNVLSQSEATETSSRSIE